MNVSALARVVLLGMVIILSACHDDDDDNTAPVADAGPDQTEGVITGDGVILDGSGSRDADGHNLSYLWSFVSVPAGSTAEFDDSTSETPAFTADLVGTYIVQLVVSDGPLDSRPDEVTITAVAPAPTVTITSPDFLSIFDTPTITVEGTVDDPLAEITVNGIDTPNDDGNYSAADIELAEGSNTVTVIATNSTGQGEDSVIVIRQTPGGPEMSVTSHRNGFIVGHVFDGCPSDEPVSIPTQVHGTITTENGMPTVIVNNVSATVKDLASNPQLIFYCSIIFNKFKPICTTLDDTRYSFSADIKLSVGAETITVTGFDDVGSTADVLNGLADYCYIAEEGADEYPEVNQVCDSAGNDPALTRNNQVKRCHAIDGCSVYLDEYGPLTPALDLRNNPMPWAQFNRVDIDFGDGVVPPDEFFVHGQDPARKLGCNVHDVCYQTCVSEDQQYNAWRACDLLMLDINKEKCRQAYPATCPYTIGDTDLWDPVRCPLWEAEKFLCYAFAGDYYLGLSIEALGFEAFKERQGQYCRTP